ncbi:hypothetical protein AN957_16245 [Cytobacillus solani]|uniref:Uncharacterized protein n=2 Tax=Cytobacillus solani TaxID=1637975 RepID=A0A0Q3VHS6_9BACI|nr:hypothetical protein AMS60_10940 [Bacillus sp. FJAT-21945]KQL19962.1 hypothetical protein AN957_16245 [Cytobacillus solani]
MKRLILGITLLVSIVLAACSGGDTKEEASPKKEKTEDIKELVQDYSVGNIKDQTASITSKQLIVTDSDESQLTYDLPEGEFFVSIAPYVNETHP